MADPSTCLHVHRERFCEKGEIDKRGHKVRRQVLRVATDGISVAYPFPWIREGIHAPWYQRKGKDTGMCVHLMMGSREYECIRQSPQVQAEWMIRK